MYTLKFSEARFGWSRVMH